ncbi:uncharacterized protein M421DRAFT_296916 [Didymella exigua CBS 183.55]|uniref:GAF domain-containing protein n=1 Tax=Didymella exigua CBS 183.55 TaxID=1150837 RepID=A0A6A5R7P4_9PLEO|nr:uncharacterized protein M421DRAFT_296916 [Didymella exigua CBS 183.55]KAF1924201.1 hypothetical protein M421DRAFT_296916 [Didymella exigua CBS 183.55]
MVTHRRHGSIDMISIFQEIPTSEASERDSESQSAFSIPTLGRDPRTSHLSAVSAPAKLSFFAGVPLTTEDGHNIGAIWVADPDERPPLAASEVEFLTNTVRRCVNLLELARERNFHDKWTAMQEELEVFLQSRSLCASSREEPRTWEGRKSSRMKGAMDKSEEHEVKRIRPGPLTGVSDPPVESRESQRLVDTETERDHIHAKCDDAEDAKPLTAKRGKDGERKGETANWKVFRRAAECLRSALKTDSVVLVDGLMGYHGEAQSAAEPEQELERETVHPPAHLN